MFSIYTPFNEGGCTDADRRCSERKLHEGKNPKAGNENAGKKRWSSGKPAIHVNANWEKLRK